jgi:hypothetical protein
MASDRRVFSHIRAAVARLRERREEKKREGGADSPDLATCMWRPLRHSWSFQAGMRRVRKRGDRGTYLKPVNVKGGIVVVVVVVVVVVIVHLLKIAPCLNTYGEVRKTRKNREIGGRTGFDTVLSGHLESSRCEGSVASP